MLAASPGGEAGAISMRRLDPLIPRQVRCYECNLPHICIFDGSTMNFSARVEA